LKADLTETEAVLRCEDEDRAVGEHQLIVRGWTALLSHPLGQLPVLDGGGNLTAGYALPALAI
jgi:hypothetical protein